jgi:hypothetical protein
MLGYEPVKTDSTVENGTPIADSAPVNGLDAQHFHMSDGFGIGTCTHFSLLPHQVN